MTDLTTLSAETFNAIVGESITVKLADSDVSLEVIDVDVRGSFDPELDTRQAFSVLLRGPQAPPLAQNTYTLEHPALGTLALFMVPAGPDRGGLRLYAVTIN